MLANVWDVGGAKMAVQKGAVALATTSAGHAWTIGKSDLGYVSREESMSHSAQIVAATDAPVSADCENGYGHSPQEVAKTIRMCIDAGLAGCSIEDTMLPSVAPYSLAESARRIEAAVAAAREAAEDFVLTARADGMMHGQYDLAESIRRLRAFESAGADVLYAPFPPTMDALAKICDSVAAPVNALAAGVFCEYRIADFAEIGIARISLGSGLARISQRATTAATIRILQGDFAALQNE